MFITRYVIHLVVPKSASVVPICGEWARSVNWTTVPAVATCPECVAKHRTAAVAAAPAEPLRA